MVTTITVIGAKGIQLPPAVKGGEYIVCASHLGNKNKGSTKRETNKSRVTANVCFIGVRDGGGGGGGEEDTINLIIILMIIIMS